jgi:dTDP-4-dehydrorhamnose reductase
VGAPTFAADLAVATGIIAQRLADLRARGHSGPEFGTFHIASAGTTTWCGFARAIMHGASARGLGPMAAVAAITRATMRAGMCGTGTLVVRALGFVTSAAARPAATRS